MLTEIVVFICMSGTMPSADADNIVRTVVVSSDSDLSQLIVNNLSA